MVIWASEVPSGIWSPTVRVGDVGGQLGGSGKSVKQFPLKKEANFCDKIGSSAFLISHQYSTNSWRELARVCWWLPVA